MKIEQLYPIVNAIGKNITKGQYNVVDHTTFVNFGNDVLSSEVNREEFYNTLVDRIGKTIIAIREYQHSNREVFVDSFTFGCILQKISFKLQDAELNSDWDNSEANLLNPYNVKAKGGIIQKLYDQSLPTWAYTDVIYNTQLESAFVDETKLIALIDGIYTRMMNSREVAIEGLSDVAISTSALYRAEMFAKSKGINTNRVFRDLLGEYLDLHPTSALTPDDAINDNDFLQFVCIELGIVIPKVGKLTSMYNDGTVERSSNAKAGDLIIEMPTKFTKTYSVKLASNTYHKSMVELPGYNEVPYWISPADEMAIKGNDGTGDYVINNVICVMRDKDSVVCTLDKDKFVSFYDTLNDRTVIKGTAERRYISDPSENSLVFYLDGTNKTVTFDKNSGTGTMANVTTHKNYLIAPDCTYTAPSNKVFSHWIVDGAETEVIKVGEIVNLNKSAITLKAVWIDA